MEEKLKIRDFTDLDVWKSAHKLTLSIYKITERFPSSEIFGLTSQIRRACVSVTSNVAEGFGRQSIKEKIQFYYHSHGSLTEAKNQIILSKDLGYISLEEFDTIIENLISTHRLLLGLLRKTKSFLKT